MQNKCQVFTPDGIVGKLLDEIGYHKNLFGKKVYENSCGTGNILVEIVKRYIEDCNENGLSDNKIKAGLEHDIFAADIDAKCCTKAMGRSLPVPFRAPTLPDEPRPPWRFLP